MTLVEFLRQTGFHRVPLVRSGVGHLSAAGTLNDRPVSVLVDTGAASTVVSLQLAREMNLALIKMPFQGGGAGAARLDVYDLPEAVLRLGTVVPRPRALLAVDLTHVNQALALKGQKPVEVVIGADVFEAQAAVIDWG